ncbi:AAA family ATPase [Alicyclobacillus kakegawensis]|uniref:AAA family ATPase n=1 Tax=Alicyclobacillus kakegawensis TaxID=392012 RepID=UPI001FE0A201|nr:ParA family protein [Alicyclobacillus kakegawensis]
MLLDNSLSAQERLEMLASYRPEHYRSLLELAGIHPDLVIVDEGQGPDVVRELQEEWGIPICVVAKRVTLQLRRRFSRVRDMISDAQLLDFLREQAEKREPQDEPREALPSEEMSASVQADPNLSVERGPETTRVSSARKAFTRPALSLRSPGKPLAESSGTPKPKPAMTLSRRSAPALTQVKTEGTTSPASTVSAASAYFSTPSGSPVPSLPPEPSKPSTPDPSPSPRPTVRQETRGGRSRRARIFAVGPLRNTGGGAGKTGFVFNFASYAAKQGFSVLVVDLDPNGVFGTLADAQGELNVAHWQHLMEQNPDANLTERAVLDSVERHPVFGFSLIAAAAKVSVISTEVLSWILNQTAPYFDLILVDMPAMWADPIVTMMQEADRLILIGLHDAAQYPHYKATLDLITNPAMRIGVPRERIRVIISRAYLGKNRDVEMEEISRQLNMPLSLIIPEDQRFYEYRENHKPIVLEKRNAEYTKTVIPWFDTQLAELRDVARNVPVLAQGLEKRRGGFFARLFGGGKKTAKIVHS